MIRPGGLRITERAISLWKLPPGARVLDVGCGQGESVTHLREKYGLDALGIDASLEMVEAAKSDSIFWGDGEKLDLFENASVDGIMMDLRCVEGLKIRSGD